VNLVFLGPPGSGKGTQAVRLAEKLGVTHLSTGDLLREAVKNETELGLKAKGFMDAGNLVPDELIIGLIEDKIAAGELSGGFILDGFPRTIPQAEALSEMLAKNEVKLDHAVLFVVTDDEIVRRLSGRWFCPECNEGYNYPAKMPEQAGICNNDGAKLERRPDDDEAVVRNRLGVYKTQTQPIEDYYRGEQLLVEIESEVAPDEVFARMLRAIGA
jgi:adenylate kinase